MSCPTILFNPSDNKTDVCDCMSPVEQISENQNPYDYSYTGMPKRYWGADFSQYPTPYTQRLQDFALGKSDKIFMVLEGMNGTGKSYNACSCIGMRIKNGFAAGSYLSCKYTLGPMIRSSKLTTGERNEMDTYRFYYNSPFTVLDEVGKCDDERLEKVFDSNLISACYDNNNRILITTNFTMNELCKWLGEDINSRFYQCAEVLTINEQDYRKTGANK